MSPAEDERDNISNVTPHAEFVGSAIYEFLPQLSHGKAAPSPAPRLELTTVDVGPSAARAFEAALRAEQPKLHDETLWYRMVAGGVQSRYVRLRPRPTLSAILDERGVQELPDKAAALVARVTVELLNLRPTMSYSFVPVG